MLRYVGQFFAKPFVELNLRKPSALSVTLVLTKKKKI